MATNQATSNDSIRSNTNSPEDPPEPSPTNPSLDRYFEVKTIVWMLSILVILFILNSHLSSASSPRPSFGSGWAAEREARRKQAKGRDNQDDERSRKNENLELNRPFTFDHYFVLNLQWGPDFVDNYPRNASLKRLQDHIRFQDDIRPNEYGFTVHNFKIHAYRGGELPYCAPGVMDDMIEELEERSRRGDTYLESMLNAYWPSFTKRLDNEHFWWYQWLAHGSCVVDPKARYRPLENSGVIGYLLHVVELVDRIQAGFEEPRFQVENRESRINLTRKYLGRKFELADFERDLKEVFDKAPYVGTRPRHTGPGRIPPGSPVLEDYFIRYIEFCYDHGGLLIDCSDEHQSGITGHYVEPPVEVRLATMGEYFTLAERRNPDQFFEIRRDDIIGE